MQGSTLLVKVYGDAAPADDALFAALRDVLEKALAAGFLTGAGVEETLARDGEGFRIAFEGLAFPFDDVMEAVDAHASRLTLNGRLDYIDMEAWRITRVTWLRGKSARKSGSLNAALDYSGF